MVGEDGVVGVGRKFGWEGGGTMYRPGRMERRVKLYKMVRIPRLALGPSKYLLMSI